MITRSERARTATELRIAFVQPIVDPVREAWFRYLARDPEIHFRVFALRRRLSHRPGWESRQDTGYDVELVRSLAVTQSRQLVSSVERNMGLRLIPLDLIWRLWRYRPNAIVVTNATELLQAIVVRWVCGASVALSAEDTRLSFSRIGRATGRLKAFLLRRADILLAHSSEARNLLLDLRIPAARIARTPWAVDNEKFATLAAQANIAEIRRKFGLQGIVFVVVAAFTVRKGIEQLLSAWALVPAELRAKASVLLVGDGPERQRLTELAHAKGLTEVRFAGHLPHQEVAACYAASDVFVLPTLEDVWGLVVNEAMAAGLPVLCSRYAGSAEDLVREGANGHVFDPLDPMTFSSLLCKLTEHPDGLAEMGRRSREIIADFTIARSVAALLHALRGSLGPVPAEEALERSAPDR